MVKSIFIWISLFFLCGAIVQFDRTQWAASTPFDNSTNGFTSTDVQAAIEEAKTTAEGKARYIVPFGFDGNGAAGRWLESFTNIPSNISGYVVAKPAIIKELTLACSASTTITIGVYNNAVQIATLVMVTSKVFEVDKNINITTLNEISAKIESGTCTRPAFYIHLRYQ